MKNTTMTLKSLNNRIKRVLHKINNLDEYKQSYDNDGWELEKNTWENESYIEYYTRDDDKKYEMIKFIYVTLKNKFSDYAEYIKLDEESNYITILDPSVC